MTSSGLHERIESIIGLQIDRSIILTGLYLTSDQLRLVRVDLEPDDPQVGAIGRYLKVPVFLLDTGRAAGARGDVSQTETYRGILFSYVRPDHVN
jgi:hypothetical protein